MFFHVKLVLGAGCIGGSGQILLYREAEPLAGRGSKNLGGLRPH